jgi:hypothetical protein
MQPSRSTGPSPKETPDSLTPATDALSQNDRRLLPEGLPKANGPEFLEGQEDPAQSAELERQQDA